MASADERFTIQWDAIDPFDQRYPHLWIKVEHLGRYIFAANLLDGADVERIADVGCGRGYGTFELAKSSRTVIGVDEDDAILEIACARYGRSNVFFRKARLGRAELSNVIEPQSLDAVVSFETLEHLTDPASALGEIEASLRSGGSLVLSVPNSLAEQIDHTGLPTNQFHRRFFTLSSITELVESAGFRVTHALGQPIASDVQRTEARLIRRKQVDGRVGDEPTFHHSTSIRRLAATIGQPEARDVERSRSFILLARKP